MTDPGTDRAPIALDAMGGDHAPGPEVDAAIAAARAGEAVTLVGDAARVRAALEARGAGDAVAVLHASDRVAMDDHAALALRRHPEASVRVAARLVADGEAGAMVSAGSTGAVLGAALLEVGRLTGVRRPALAATLPVPGTDGVVLVDAGGSPDAPTDAVVGFAAMGAALARSRGIDRPRVGLLNVGTEPGRGNAAARDAHAALQHTAGFVGNVEPDGVLAGAVDVVVADAFTGNVFLKTLEAVTALVGGARPGSGAALVLGVRAPVLVAHGAAGSEELQQALQAARGAIDARLVDGLAGELDAPAAAAERR